ncbi:MAG: septum formation initiator family protein [Gordonibacter sp.]|nr:septum formation initiator family protein [Gordonibacter sp.]
MGKQANILSFDEAKREVGAVRPSNVAPKSSSRKRSAGSSVRSGSASPLHAATGSRKASSDFRSSTSSLKASSRIASRSAVTTYTGRSDAPSRKGSFLPDSIPASSRSGAQDNECEEEEVSSEKLSRWEQFRRKHQKERAGKKFSKQFGNENSASDSSSGSRAAVYKGEMGSSHKRSSRMQNESSSKASSRRSPLAVLSAWRESPKFIGSVATFLCIMLTCWFLYTPTQQLYQSVREHDRLEAEYAAIEARNNALQSEVQALQTSAGIEDRAHEQFGWVPEGQETANVKGLSNIEDNDSRFTANIVPGSIEAPTTWYSPLLDTLFGVK